MSDVSPRRTVLITGCSDGGLGAAMALAFQKAGFRVLATARNAAKMSSLEAAGVEVLVMDPTSTESIKHCLSEVTTLVGSRLDILVNNAGTTRYMPISDLDLNDARQVFEVNVWGYLAVTQAFLPLLVASKGMVVNHTSVAAVIAMPWGGVYGASKAAISALSNTMRLEFAPFDIRVVDLKTGSVQSQVYDKLAQNAKLPENSLYHAAREDIEEGMRLAETAKTTMDAKVWAEDVVRDLTKTRPPLRIWRGKSALILWIATTFGSMTSLDWGMRKATKLDVAETKIRAARAASIAS